MRSRLVALILSAGLVTSLSPFAARAAPGDPDLKSLMQKELEAWETLDPARVAPLYAKEADRVFFDITPLRYAGWKEWKSVRMASQDYFNQGGFSMKRPGYSLIGMLLVASLYGAGPRDKGKSKDEKEIRALEDRFVAAFRAKDIDAIMKNYAPGGELFVFDVTPPRQHVGPDDYKKDWQDFFAAFPGPVNQFELTDLSITTDGKLGYGHSIQHAVMTAQDGSRLDLTVRVTDSYRKINGKWLVTEEHVSVPVDLATGKADLTSKP